MKDSYAWQLLSTELVSCTGHPGSAQEKGCCSDASCQESVARIEWGLRKPTSVATGAATSFNEYQHFVLYKIVLYYRLLYCASIFTSMSLANLAMAARCSHFMEILTQKPPLAATFSLRPRSKNISRQSSGNDPTSGF